MSLAPRLKRFLLSASGIGLLASLVLALGALVAFAISDAFFLELAKSRFSTDGTFSPTGVKVFHRSLLVLRWGSGGAAVVLCAGALVLRLAERRVDATSSSRSPSDRPPRTWDNADTWMALAAVALFVGISVRHLGESLFCDELMTLKEHAAVSWARVIGADGYFTANNHILNTALVRLSLVLGFRSEIGLRIWSFVAGIFAIPVAIRLGQVLRFRRASLFLLLILVATSPVLARYSTMARGYALAIFLTAASTTLHLLCAEKPTRLRLWLLAITNMFLLLAHFLTFLFGAAQVLHLVVEAFDPRSRLRRVGHPMFREHLLALVGGSFVAVLISAFSLPYVVRDIVQFASQEHMTWRLILGIASSPLVLEATPALGLLILLAAIFTVATNRPTTDVRAGRFFVAFALLTCLLAAICSRRFEVRMQAYLFLPTLMVAGLVFQSLAAMLPRPAEWAGALVLASGIGAPCAVLSFRHPPIQDYRGLIAKAHELAGGRVIWSTNWTGGYGPAAWLDYYDPGLVVVHGREELPKGQSIYVSPYDVTGMNVILFDLVQKVCRRSFKPPSEGPIALYDCPGLDTMSAR